MRKIQAGARQLGRSGTSRPRRTEWEAFDAPFQAQGPFSLQFQIMGLNTEIDLEYSEPTLVRTRGNFNVYSLGLGGVVFGGFGAAGIILATTDGNGNISVPSPLAQPDAEWIWFSYWSVRNTVVGDPIYGATHRFEIDSRAMRKWSSEESLIFVMESDINSSSLVGWDAAARFLLKE